jgi:hypothetical protein
MSISTPVVIYPSQLPDLKRKVEELATAIAESLNQNRLSAFKRNDYIAASLGYKSYSDLKYKKSHQFKRIYE